jgi:hypothetical protein
MKLWFLRPHAGWAPFDDNAVGLLIKAESEADARELAARLLWPRNTARDDRWNEPQNSTCVQVDVKNKGALNLRSLRDALR